MQKKFTNEVGLKKTKQTNRTVRGFQSLFTERHGHLSTKDCLFICPLTNADYGKNAASINSNETGKYKTTGQQTTAEN